MSLHAVLSAMRALILDGLDIPLDEIARKDFYRTKFPELSEEEREDLTLIPPGKFGIYTSTVFSGQKGTVEMHFPMTLRLMECRRKSPVDVFRLVQQVHQQHPWKGYATQGLTESFVSYLRGEQEYSRSAPEIADLAASEHLSLEIARGYNPFDKDIPRTYPPFFTAPQIQTLQISELLQAPLFVPENVRFLEASYDILEIRHDYLVNEKSVPEQILPNGQFFLVGGRDAEQYIRWYEITPGFFSLLKRIQTGAQHSVEDLAEIFLREENDSSERRPNEQELFQSFLSRLWILINNGSVFVLSPSAKLC